MRIRNYTSWRTLVVPLAVIALGLAACGGDDTAGNGSSTPADGGSSSAPGASDTGGAPSPTATETVTVGSFNFPESVILAEIYAQALENNGVTVERELNIGARELIYPDLEDGAIDVLPEYVGSALSVGFGGSPTSDTQATLADLETQLNAVGVTALEPSQAQDKNVFVVTSDFAQTNDVSKISDLAGLGDLTLGGPPECEERQTCYAGLVDVYGLDNLTFQSIQEGTVRVESLANGEIDVSLLFSTDPTIKERGFVALDDDQGLIAAENVVPVVNQDIVDAYGDAVTGPLNAVSAALTTDALIDMNGQANAGDDPADIARQWLQDNGLMS